MIEFILCAFAAYRIARMLAQEEGAFEIFERIRARFDPAQETWVGRGLNCQLCIGFWVSLGFSILLVLDNPTFGKGEFVLYWFAIAGGQTVIAKVLEVIENGSNER